jgi:MFS-type transporter involved in bile tolerance (Atg22 family)
MRLHWPQVVYLAICAIQILLAVVCDYALDRKPQTPMFLAFAAFYIWLLWSGGFFG